MSKPFPKYNAAADYLQQKKPLVGKRFLNFSNFCDILSAGRQTAALPIPATAGNGMPYTDHPEPKLW